MKKLLHSVLDRSLVFLFANGKFNFFQALVCVGRSQYSCSMIVLVSTGIGKPSEYGTSHPGRGQLSMIIFPWVSKMFTSLASD